MRISFHPLIRPLNPPLKGAAAAAAANRASPIPKQNLLIKMSFVFVTLFTYFPSFVDFLFL